MRFTQPFGRFELTWTSRMRSGVKERRVWLMKTHFPREVLGLNLNTPLNMCTETGGASWFLPEPGDRGRIRSEVIRNSKYVYETCHSFTTYLL